MWVRLVVERDDGVVGIDVKAGRTVSPRDTCGLASLAELVRRGRRFQGWILYRGESRQRFDDGTEV